MIILGIDPGYAIVGCGVIEYKNNHFSVIEYSAITTPAGMPFNRRLEVIYDGVDEMIKRTHPDALSIEKLFFNSNQKTVIDVGQARGVIMLAAQKNSLPAFEYTPLQVKQSVVGYGRAEKKQVQEMTKMLLHLDKIPKPDDVADALNNIIRSVEAEILSTEGAIEMNPIIKDHQLELKRLQQEKEERKKAQEAIFGGTEGAGAQSASDDDEDEDPEDE